jgi:hypothetical protein
MLIVRRKRNESNARMVLKDVFYRFNSRRAVGINIQKDQVRMQRTENSHDLAPVTSIGDDPEITVALDDGSDAFADKLETRYQKDRIPP